MAELPPLDEIRATPVSPADEDRARLEVARRAENADDARQLLAMLGLDNVPMRKARRGNRDWPSNLSRAKAPAKPAPAKPAATVIRRKEWSDEIAGCRDDPEQWFSEFGSESAAEAKQICYGCPSRRACGEAGALRDERLAIVAGFHTADPDEWQRLWDWLEWDMPKKQQRSSRRRSCAQCGNEFTSQRRDTTRCVPCIQGLLPATPVREHIEALWQRQGLTRARVAKRAHVSASVVTSVANGQPYVSRVNAERILALPLEAVSV